MIVPVKLEKTAYHVENDVVVETVTTEDWELETRRDGLGGETWLHFTVGYMSMPFKSVPDAIARGGWICQGGTKPTYVEPCASYVKNGNKRPCAADCGCGPDDGPGGWFHKTSPQYKISAEELSKAYRHLVLPLINTPGKVRCVLVTKERTPINNRVIVLDGTPGVGDNILVEETYPSDAVRVDSITWSEEGYAFLWVTRF